MRARSCPAPRCSQRARPVAVRVPSPRAASAFFSHRPALHGSRAAPHSRRTPLLPPGLYRTRPPGLSRTRPRPPGLYRSPPRPPGLLGAQEGLRVRPPAAAAVAVPRSVRLPRQARRRRYVGSCAPAASLVRASDRPHAASVSKWAAEASRRGRSVRRRQARRRGGLATRPRAPPATPAAKREPPPRLPPPSRPLSVSARPAETLPPAAGAACAAARGKRRPSARHAPPPRSTAPAARPAERAAAACPSHRRPRRPWRAYCARQVASL
mmetsp:Transcript_1005/g.2665  ORF Transcript_1005/g.2665 Transcript_1005/m.2665 type:complete len:268 (-) Transcript_1005:39-842(-)